MLAADRVVGAVTVLELAAFVCLALLAGAIVCALMLDVGNVLAERARSRERGEEK